MTQVAYLDASAMIKLARVEPHSDACRRFLSTQPTDLVSSQIVVTETHRSLRRLADSDQPAAALDDYFQFMFLLSINEQLVRDAAALAPTTLRTLDALHVASALRMRNQITAFVTYDLRQAAAATLVGLPVVTPHDD